MIAQSTLQQIVDKAPQLSIALIGDLFLDRYLEIAAGVHEDSIETGLEAYQIDRVRNSPGALGTVMNNLAALGVGKLIPVTVIGDDGHGYDLLKQLESMPVDASCVVQSQTRLTPTYTKPLRHVESGEPVELNRLDVRNRHGLSPQETEAVCANLDKALATADGLIVMDQINETNWGVVNQQVRSRIEDLCAADDELVVFVDSRQHIGSFEAGILKGNDVEFCRATGMDDYQQAAIAMARQTNRIAYCTCGDRGILVAHPSGEVSLVAGFPVDGPVDIVGAGDSATSGMVTSLLCNASPEDSASVGNLVASITVQQLGTTGTASPQQLLQRFSEVS